MAWDMCSRICLRHISLLSLHMKDLQRKRCLDENNQENAIFVSVFLFSLNVNTN